MKEATNIFRVLIKTLLNAGIITDRTRAFYGIYVDMDELKAEGDRMVGDDIAEEGMRYLQAINFGTAPRPRIDRRGIARDLRDLVAPRRIALRAAFSW